MTETNDNNHNDEKTTVADSIEDDINEHEVSADVEQTFHAVEMLEGVRDALDDVAKHELPPSVRERYVEGEGKILDALGEAEALYEDAQTPTDETD